MVAISMIAITAILICGSSPIAAQISSGYATYSNGGGGVCQGGSSGLPSVAMNAAQFANGAACGQCVQISGTGNGAGKTPVSTAPYIAVINNVCPQCSYGDIDLQESGDGKFGITWSFVGCPGAGRKLIEQPFNGDKTVYVVRGHAEQSTKEHTPESVVHAAEEKTQDNTAQSEENEIPQEVSELIARELIEEPVEIVNEPTTVSTAESGADTETVQHEDVSKEVPAGEESTEEGQKVSRRLMRA